MRTKFAEWLDQMQHVADNEDITVAARHYDFLDFLFKSKKGPIEAFAEYKKFLVRWNAITDNGHNTEALNPQIFNS